MSTGEEQEESCSGEITTEPTSYYTVATSCCSEQPVSDLVRDIIGREPELVQAPSTYGIGPTYPWTIDNKYYTAHTHVATPQHRTIVDERFADGVQAIIVFFNAADKSSFEHAVNMWKTYWVHWSPDVRLLLCDRCSDDDDGVGLARQHVWNWCIENQFELIEYRDPDYDDEENIDPKTEAVKRVRSALNSHQWPNLVMKKDKKNTAVTADLSEQFATSVSLDITKESSDKEKKGEARAAESRDARIESLFDDSDGSLFSAVGDGEDPGGESFEGLFSRMADMKAAASKITDDAERKAYAEKVAIMFWKAMGGDEDEIDGLDDD